jgi:hypothetical protein
MKHDFSGVASDADQKLFRISPSIYLAPTGWKAPSDYQVDVARKLGTSDIRALAEALERESLAYLTRFVEVLGSIKHVHEKIGRALAGELTLHATVLAGRTVAGELGYINQVYRVQAGRVVCESGEYFGGEGRIYTTSGEPAQQAVREDPSILTGGPVEVVRKLLAALKREWPTIGGPDQIIRMDGDGACWISGPPAGREIVASHGLEIATALFAGDAVFAYQNGGVGGGKVTINSVGVAIANHLSSPTATVTVTSGGVTIARNTNNVQIDSNGFKVVQSGVTAVQVDATGISITKGSSNVTVSATAVDIANGRLGLTSNGVTTQINNATPTGPFNAGAGIYMTRTSDGSFSAATPVEVAVVDSSGVGYSILARSLSGFNDYGYVRLQQKGTGTSALLEGTAVLTLSAGGAVGSLTPTRLTLNGNIVVQGRQTGPGNTSDASDVAVRFNNLLAALRAHGLIT